ncbi:MAG TPA: tryptophan-rich sensory protein [Thermogutta sp.]|nr:tryptophan-rich sensory protein [Thermogutta sp.]HPZ83516.1 tryptophan-rich sensory protein [Thermogutta sp.]
MMGSAKQVIGLVLIVGVCLGAGLLGSIATTSQVDGWYKTLNKPSWNPPSQVFGPVWTTLYILMGVAAWLVWRSADARSTWLPLALFGIQLALNAAWSWIFFKMQRPDWAFFEILILWVAIAATLVAFFRHSQLAGWLLVPYLAWVSFAAILNFTIWRLNT